MAVEDRKLEVLRAIVEDFISTNEPVGSKALVDRHNPRFGPIRSHSAISPTGGSHMTHTNIQHRAEGITRREIGREAASLLIKRIGAPEGNARTIRLKPKLVMRTTAVALVLAKRTRSAVHSRSCDTAPALFTFRSAQESALSPKLTLKL